MQEESKKKNHVVYMDHITKTFGGIVALDDVSLGLNSAEVLGLVGDNGAGKSTLIKILSGVYPPNKGNIYIEGKEITLRSPREAWGNGIATVYQELALAGKMNAIENIFLGHELGKDMGNLKVLNKARMEEEAEELLGRLGIELESLHEPVQSLSGGERQAVAISRALNLEAKVIILDEPTSALAVGEAEKVLSFVERLKETGKSVIMISHNLQHVFRVADRAAILRNGNLVGLSPIDELDQDTGVKLITGTQEFLSPEFAT